MSDTQITIDELKKLVAPFVADRHAIFEYYDIVLCALYRSSMILMKLFMNESMNDR